MVNVNKNLARTLFYNGITIHMKDRSEENEEIINLFDYEDTDIFTMANIFDLVSNDFKKNYCKTKSVKYYVSKREYENYELCKLMCGY